MNTQSMRPGSVLASQGQSRLHRAADYDDQEGNSGEGDGPGGECRTIDQTPQNGYGSGSDAQRGWVDADGSDDATPRHRGIGAGLGGVGNQPLLSCPVPSLLSYLFLGAIKTMYGSSRLSSCTTDTRLVADGYYCT